MASSLAASWLAHRSSAWWPYRRERLPGGLTVESVFPVALGSPVAGLSRAVGPSRAASRWLGHHYQLPVTVESGNLRERHSGFRTVGSGSLVAGWSTATPRWLDRGERLPGSLIVESRFPVALLPRATSRWLERRGRPPVAGPSRTSHQWLDRGFATVGPRVGSPVVRPWDQLSGDRTEGRIH